MPNVAALKLSGWSFSYCPHAIISGCFFIGSVAILSIPAYPAGAVLKMIDFYFQTPFSLMASREVGVHVSSFISQSSCTHFLT